MYTPLNNTQLNLADLFKRFSDNVKINPPKPVEYIGRVNEGVDRRQVTQITIETLNLNGQR